MEGAVATAATPPAVRLPAARPEPARATAARPSRDAARRTDALA